MSDQVCIILPEVQLYDVNRINDSLALQHEIQISEGSEANECNAIIPRVTAQKCETLQDRFKTSETN